MPFFSYDKPGVSRGIAAVFIFLWSIAICAQESWDWHRKNLIYWKMIDPLTWNDFDRWRVGKHLKDADPNWKEKFIDNTRREPIGFVLDCMGKSCFRFRGEVDDKIDTDNELIEGDEINTGNTAHLWAFLLDGTLVHMAPDSSLTLKEINVGERDIFYHVRLNYGKIFWLSRSGRLPEKVYPHLTPLIRESNLFVRGKSHHLLLVMPNGTVSLGDGNAKFSHISFAHSYVKIIADDVLLQLSKREGYATLFYRGLENTDSFTLKENTWYRVESGGKLAKAISDDAFAQQEQHAIEGIVPALIKRELSLQRRARFLFESPPDKEQLARHGYRLWSGTLGSGGELQARRDFLIDHTRRNETLLLARTRRLLEKLHTDSNIAK